MTFALDEKLKILGYLRNYVLRDTQIPKQTQGLWVDLIDEVTMEVRDGGGETSERTGPEIRWARRTPRPQSVDRSRPERGGDDG